jgi:hypothetical protein
METVQITLTDAAYTAALRELLERGGNYRVSAVEAPDPYASGVIVVDAEALESLPFPMVNPERVVLITSNDPQHLSRAWNAGIRSVVFSADPLGTAVLAIMAAELRVSAVHVAPAGAGLARAGLAKSGKEGQR